MTNNKLILVTGATGQQGGATARHLLSGGWAVRGLTRNVESPAALALAQAGAEVVRGDLADLQSLEAAMEGAYGVFSFPNLSPGPEIEVEQGKAVAGAAMGAGVQHFVQGSVGGAERESHVPHFESKWQIEEYVRYLNLPATFLRPAYFMENFVWKRDAILAGTYESLGISPGSRLQMIAADDIGAFAALALDNPTDYVGRAIELAGDELTEPQMAEFMSRAIGRSVELVPPSAPPPNQDWAAMIRFFEEDGFNASIPDLRAAYPQLTDFGTWLRNTGWTT